MVLTEHLRRYQWILTEIKYINILGHTGALSFFSDAIQSKIGTIFLGRSSGGEIGKVLSSLFVGQSVVACTAYVVVTGMVAATGVLCSQAYGAKDYKLVGTYFSRALLISSLTCFPIWTMWICVHPVVFHLSGDIQLATGASAYTTVVCFSYPAYIYVKLANSFLQAQNKVVATITFLITGNILNIILQYIFIIMLGFESEGVAISYVISTYVVAVLVFSYIRLTNIHKEYLDPWSYGLLTEWSHFLRYGIPGVLQKMNDLVISRVIPIVLLGFVLKNRDEVALVGIFNTLWFVLLSISLGYGSGVTVRVGNLLGSKEPEKAKRASLVSLVYGLALVVLFGVLISSFAYYLSLLFTTDEEFRVRVEFGIRIVGLCIAGSDVAYIVRGVFNACCLQTLETLIRFIAVVLGSIIGCVVSYYVTWKATGFYLVMGVSTSCTIIVELIILYCYDWRKIAEYTLENTQSGSRGNGLEDDIPRKNVEYSNKRKVGLILKYMIPLVISAIVFFIVMYQLFVL